MDSISKIYITEVSDLHKNAELVTALMDSFREVGLSTKVLTGTVLIVGGFDELAKFEKAKPIVNKVVSQNAKAFSAPLKLTGFEKGGMYYFKVTTKNEDFDLD